MQRHLRLPHLKHPFLWNIVLQKPGGVDKRILQRAASAFLTYFDFFASPNELLPSFTASVVALGTIAILG